VVPGLVGLILTMTMVMLTSMALARERERGTLEQIIVSPVTRLELITGKITPYVMIGYVQMSLVLFLGKYVFQVPIVGSLPLLYGVAFLFISACLALGMFISTMVQTQQQAMQMTFFVFLPNVLLSGFMFPFQAMPRAAQFIGECLPLTHFLRMVRAIVLRGAGLTDLTRELSALTIIVVVLVAVATVRFRKKLG
jgi:ABC-2 type transport system permease protein